MATRETGGTSANRGQEQHGTSGTGGAAAQAGSTSGTQGTTQGTQGSGTQTGARSDQQRRMQVSREAPQRGRSVARRQQPFLPSLFAAPPGLLTSAFMSNPFEFMRRMTDDMNQIFESSGFGTTLTPSGSTQRGLTRGAQAAGGVWFPQVDVRERGNELVVSADLPGIKPDDVNIEAADGVLTLSGERRQEEEEEREGFYRSERSYGTFYRTIPLPEGVNEDQISASFNDGVLEVRVPLPQQQQRQGRKIPIK